MSQAWLIGAQLSTSHSPPASLALDRMVAAVERSRAIVDLQILILGAREIPEIFRGMTGRSRIADRVFLWFNVLSDIPDMEEDDLVVNWRGERSKGWRGWAERGSEVDETFRFACPNNPAVRRKVMSRLRELLTSYDFDGVFLDKVRFPSPANGLDEVISCFCEHCRRAASGVGLDLNEVADVFAQPWLARADAAAAVQPAGSWLDVLATGVPVLGQFARFRSRSITQLVADIQVLAKGLGRELALDLFSAGLAPLVGQDYATLQTHAVWAKPMTYRIAAGPAGLRLEIPALVAGVCRMLAVSEAVVSDWAGRYVPGFQPDTVQQTRAAAVPLKLMTEEIRAAVNGMAKIPVYFGLEVVRHPGIIETTPVLVHEMVEAGRAAGAAGAIISWDLMHAPADGLYALASALKTH